MKNRTVLDDYFELPHVVARMNEKGRPVQETKIWCKKHCTLDYDTDEPLPQWALDILGLGRISYRGRKYLLVEHNKDIFRARNGDRIGKRWIRETPHATPDDFEEMERRSREALGIPKADAERVSDGEGGTGAEVAE